MIYRATFALDLSVDQNRNDIIDEILATGDEKLIEKVIEQEEDFIFPPSP